MRLQMYKRAIYYIFYNVIMNSEIQTTKKITVCNHILQTVENETRFGNLYLGGVGAVSLEVINAFQISAILSLMDKYMYEKKQISKRIQDYNITDSKWIDIEDEEQTEISKHFEQCYDFIQKCLPQRNVLVHCHAGVSRSGTIVIYYVMKKLNISLEMANKLVVSKRYMVSPNQGFWNSLVNHQISLLKNKNKEKKIAINQESQFNSDKYPQKFANHIISTTEQKSLDRGNLFLGQFSILKSQFLKSLKIKSILSIVDQSYYKRMKVKQIIEHENIQNHLWFNVKDEPQEDISKHFNQSFEFINKNLEQGNVLVHCQAGVSRSASIVIAFLIKKFKLDYREALNHVVSKRKYVKPNSGFQLKLIEYSQKIIA